MCLPYLHVGLYGVQDCKNAPKNSFLSSVLRLSCYCAWRVTCAVEGGHKGLVAHALMQKGMQRGEDGSNRIQRRGREGSRGEAPPCQIMQLGTGTWEHAQECGGGHGTGREGPQ